MNEIVRSVVRAVLHAAGGWLVARGWTTQGSLEEAIGALILLIGFTMSVLRAAKNQQSK
ncbi:MAG: hypothetical protein N2379_10895 [Verrucomicrobiae bacterium]|nr:hypothetical protein [Verrucomicrobiae bacterium]